MRRYDIVSGILLILSIIEFALAAPVLVQETRQADVDVVHIPKDVITVLGKRGIEGAEKLEMVTLDYFKSLGKPPASSDAHASSSSAPPGADHGSTNVMQPNPASSTAPSVEGVGDALSDGRWPQPYGGNNELHSVPLDGPASSAHGLDHGLTGAHAPLPKLPNPNPNLRPSTDSGFNMNLLPAPARPAGAAASQKELGQAHGYQVGHVQQPNPGPSADSDFDWEYWRNLKDDPPPTGPPSSKPSDPNPSKKLGFKWKQWANPLKLKDKLAPVAKLASSKPSNPNPSTKSNVNWKHWVNPLNLMDPLTPEAKAKLELSKPSNPNPSTKSNVDWKHWMNPLNLMDPLTPEGRVALSKPSYPIPSDPGPSTSRLTTKLDSQPNMMAALRPPPPSPKNPQAGLPKIGPPRKPEDKAVQGSPPNPELAPPEPDLGPLKEPENEVAPGPPSTPELGSDSQSLNPETFQAAIYAAKGKGKQSRPAETSPDSDSE